MKTKFIKVPVSDRKPKVTKEYFTDKGFVKYDGLTKMFFDALPVKYWLDEVPDLEDEYRDMLEKAKEQLKMDARWLGTASPLIKEIELLLQKTK